MRSRSDNLLILKNPRKERLFYLSMSSNFRNLRKKLKKPLGMLIATSHPKSTEYIKELIRVLKPEKIITVGDIVTSYMLSSDIKPDLAIIDMKAERKPLERQDILSFFTKLFEVENPPGMLSYEAHNKVKLALENNNSLLLVRGEEDLLVLSALKEARENSIIFYGMPKLGIVAVYCTKNKKKAINKILSRES